MPWTKCFGHDCNMFRKRYTLRCCGNIHKAECYKSCNITDEDLIIREPCTPRCVNGVLGSGKCKCDKGYLGNCCGKILTSCMNIVLSCNILVASFLTSFIILGIRKCFVAFFVTDVNKKTTTYQGTIILKLNEQSSMGKK